MIPSGGTVRSGMAEPLHQPSRTWKLNVARGKVTGMTDGLDAVRQAVHCILQTDRYRHVIYSYNYGQEFSGLIGMNAIFVQSEMKRMLKEALLQDDRIQDVRSIEMEGEGDQLKVRFEVVTDIGSFSEEVVVNV